jgi:predicted CXXCH cytochrome family protein
MKKRTTTRKTRSIPRRRVLAPLGVVCAAGLAAIIVNSCSGITRTIVAPPQIAGAEFVGSEACADCHEDITDGFHTATHANLMAAGDNAKDIGCESCHGAASLHVESGGERGTVVNPNRSPLTCFGCHLDTRGEFSLPHAHPVIGGPLGMTSAKVACSDCHAPHEGPAIIGGGMAIAAETDTCTGCHPAQRGPWVFEHEAMREGCTVCHQPHGSVNAALLTERDSTLCMKCHFQEQASAGQVLIGGRNHANDLARGTCYSTGCHEAVHGSQVNSSLRY